MPVFTMSGPYPLSHRGIDSNIPLGTAGVFVLGTINGRGNLKVVEAIGRSDSDLAAELKRHVGKSPEFLFQRAGSAAEAFQMECDLFHQIRRFDFPHPVRPSGTLLKCSICGAWGIPK